MQSIKVTYTDSKLRILVEEFIAMQKADFTFKEVCSYILYRAMEEERTTNKGLYESNQLNAADCNRVSNVLEKIGGERRISATINGNDIRYEIIKQ